ncbi:MAG TPA: hypothetical protein VGC36_14970 [Rhizomicrobium sp.]
MSIKNILKAAVAAVALTLGGTAVAEAAPFHGGHGGPGFGSHAPRHDVRRVVDHRFVFRAMQARHLRAIGNPYFHRDRYVVRTYDRFGRVAFVQINPYTGAIIGFVRL